jgi:hypothetical protein
MRDRALLPVALAAFLCPLIVDAVQGRQPQAGPGPQAAPAGQTESPGRTGGRGGQGAGGVLGGVGGPGRGRGPAGPTPRRADGSVILGSVSSNDKGIWLPGAGGFQTLFPEDTKIPMHDWARGVLADRLRNQLEPHTRCKPSGLGRQFLTPYGVEIVEFPELKRIYIFDIGGPHTYRTIYTDGRTHPPDLEPSFYGHSIGWWDGDTLVVDTVGFNEAFWMDRRGTPHTEELHAVERFTRTDARTIRYEIEVEDPGAYTERWQGGFTLGWSAGEELFEYVCQQANYADNLMVGEHSSIDRTTPIVP